MQKNKNKFAFNGGHLQNIKSKFEEKTGARLKRADIKSFKPRIIIAATIIAALFLMGAGFSLIAIRVFDADGNSFLQYIPFYQRIRPLQNDAQSIFEREEFYADNENLLLFIKQKNGDVGWNDEPKRIINDYDELQKFIDGDIFKLPQYIPGGFEFSEAVITFFIDENFDFDNAELVYREEKFGDIYEKYYIPENLDNLKSISIFWETNTEPRNQINYGIWLIADEVNDITLSGHANTEIEKFEMPQFDRAVMLTTIQKYDRDKIATYYTFNAYNPIPAKRFYSFFNKHLESQGVSHRIPAEYITVGYSINPSGLSRNEIIKIAESIR